MQAVSFLDMLLDFLEKWGNLFFFLLLIVIVAAVICIQNSRAERAEKKRNDPANQERLPVKVIQKNMELQKFYKSGDDDTPGSTGTHEITGRYRVLFELPDGTRRELPVGPDHYGCMNEGDDGILVLYRGKEVLRFEKTERI